VTLWQALRYFFAEALVGYAGAPENRFTRQIWMRVALGIGYRL